MTWKYPIRAPFKDFRFDKACTEAEFRLQNKGCGALEGLGSPCTGLGLTVPRPPKIPYLRNMPYIILGVLWYLKVYSLIQGFWKVWIETGGLRTGLSSQSLAGLGFQRFGVFCNVIIV